MFHSVLFFFRTGFHRSYHASNAEADLFPYERKPFSKQKESIVFLTKREILTQQRSLAQLTLVLSIFCVISDSTKHVLFCFAETEITHL